jgi:hypothetical protein
MTEAQLEILKKNTEIFKEASKWKARKYYIAKGIDKGKEKDGVKFWRFKENYKNNGVMDKLAPLMGEYIDVYGEDFADPEKGSNLSITMAENEWNGKTYMAVSALSFRPPSKLHEDPIIMKQWLEDDTTWRDVFLPKKAPGITSLQYLELAANNQNPYWDDTDPQNKRWVFPGHPELEEQANNRMRENRSDNAMENDIPQASDLSYSDNNAKSTSTFTETPGTDVASEVKTETQSTTVDNSKNNEPMVETQPTSSTEYEMPDDDYDDLPF